MRKLLARVVALACLCLPIASHAWWNDEWQFRKEITLDLSAAGANVSGSASDVPVLIRLHLGNFGYFNDTKPDGSDVRFVAGDDKTPLQFHIERYDPANQLAFIWVKVPQVAGGTANTKLWMYYGNSKAPAGAASDSTYDAQQALVLHLEGEGAAQDSTANHNHAATPAGQFNSASLIGGGVKLAGNATIEVPAAASLRIPAARGGTVSAWIRIEGPQTDATVLRLGDDAASVRLSIDGTKAIAEVTSGGASVASVQSADVLAAGQWHHLAAVIGDGRLLLYVDGTEIAASPVTVGDIGGALRVGGSSVSANLLTAEVDEVQIASVARTAGWLQLAAASQGVDSKMVVYGGDAQKEGGDVSYFAITMKNVTVDGWVVIIILAVMFVIASMVMVAKAMLLTRAKRANAQFREEFERLKANLARSEVPHDDVIMPSMSKDEQRFRRSTLYGLYQQGVAEMTQRVGMGSVGARAASTMSAQAIEAIRATMDAKLVRTTQLLQARMVLLTIAISGGPFLGLLGTVVGVMITFAAIAASGDVNVNSIAPGIAAALAATVAGLAVAIPALFGYNWLNTQIKEVNADMHVFVDEFITRIAEHYS